MSARAVRWAFRQELASTTKFVLVAIAEAAREEDWLCWPSQTTLATKTGLGVRTVRREIANLRDMGLIETEHRNRRDRSRTSDYIRLLGSTGADSAVPAKGDPNELDETPSSPVIPGPVPNRPDRPNRQNRGHLEATQAGPLAATQAGLIRTNVLMNSQSKNSQEEPPGELKPSVRSERGTRVPKDFMVTEKMREWAKRESPALDVDRETASFVDYWLAKSGSTAMKRDWVAAWRMWFRNGQKYAERDGWKPPIPVEPDPVEAWVDPEIVERNDWLETRGVSLAEWEVHHDDPGWVGRVEAGYRAKFDEMIADIFTDVAEVRDA